MNLIISTKNKLLFTGLFLFSSAILINHFVKSTPSLHIAKDAGLSNIVIFHCIASYLFFIMLKRNTLAYIGLGFLIGILTCILEIGIMNCITWNPPDYYQFVLLNQIIADVIIFIIGLIYLQATNSTYSNENRN